MNPQHQSVSITLHPWNNFKSTCWEKCQGYTLPPYTGKNVRNLQ